MNIRVKVIPNAPKTKISDRPSRADVDIVVEVKGMMKRNAANKELINFLAKHYDKPKKDLRIVSGMTGRIKLIRIMD